MSGGQHSVFPMCEHILHSTIVKIPDLCTPSLDEALVVLTDLWQRLTVTQYMYM